MTERLIDTYRWGACRFDLAAMFLHTIARLELRAQAMPHSEGWSNLSGDDPPIEFIRSMQGATALDQLETMLARDAAIEDLVALSEELV